MRVGIFCAQVLSFLVKMPRFDSARFYAGNHGKRARARRGRLYFYFFFDMSFSPTEKKNFFFEHRPCQGEKKIFFFFSQCFPASHLTLKIGEILWFCGFLYRCGEPGRASRARVPTLAQVGGLRRNVRISRPVSHKTVVFFFFLFQH